MHILANNFLLEWYREKLLLLHHYNAEQFTMHCVPCVAIVAKVVSVNS